MLRLALIACLAATLPSAAQNGSPQQPQTRPAPGGQPGGRPPGGQNPGGGGQQPPPNQGRPPGQGDGRPPGGGNPPPPRPEQPKPKPPPPKPPPPKPPPPKPPPPKPPPPKPRPPQWGRPPVHLPPYYFRPSDRAYLHRYYASRLLYINRAHRPVFVVGGYLPWGDIGYLTAVPPSLYGSLPPIPRGYQAAYWNGYVIVYDPLSGYIGGVIDLLQ
jgi:hypothetical protein